MTVSFEDQALLRSIAEPNTMLRGLVGLTVHGLALGGMEDRDEMGVSNRANVLWASESSSSSSIVLPQSAKDTRALGLRRAILT